MEHVIMNMSLLTKQLTVSFSHRVVWVELYPPKKKKLKPKPTVPVNVTLFSNLVLAGVVEL